MDYLYKLDSGFINVMNGNINHKRPYRFTFCMDTVMAFITKEVGYDYLRENLQVKINEVM